MYIVPKMIEPATASIVVYLLAKSPINISQNRKLLLKKPYFMKRKICKWIHYNKHELADRIIDETSDSIIDIINVIKIINMNPSIFMIIYIILLIIIIII
jgi:hypothetical protein